MWLYLSSSLYGIPLRCDLFWKRINPKNFLFIATNNRIHGFRDSVPVRKLYACCYDMQKFQAKQAVLVVFKAKAVYIRFDFKTF